MQRLDILDFLRGWASVLVLISHLVGVFWVSQSGLESLLGYENIGDINLPYASWVINNRLFFGQFGVAIFFLISGYVITLSLERYNHFGFIINRIIRIYPVYILGFVILIAGLHIVDFADDGIPYTKEHLVIHSLIVVRQWLDYQRIDGISWTLEIELYFYLILFILFQFKNNTKHILISIFFLLVLMLVQFSSLDWYETRQLLMIGYMLLGYFFFRFINNNISILQVLLSFVVVQLVMYSFFTSTKIFSNDFWAWYTPYLFSPLLFSALMIYRKDYKIDVISKFFSKISYPLYVVHPIFGYAMLVYLLKNGYSSWLSLSLVCILVIAIAYSIHILIEKPALRYAKRLKNKND